MYVWIKYVRCTFHNKGFPGPRGINGEGLPGEAGPKGNPVIWIWKTVFRPLTFQPPIGNDFEPHRSKVILDFLLLAAAAQFHFQSTAKRSAAESEKKTFFTFFLICCYANKLILNDVLFLRERPVNVVKKVRHSGQIKQQMLFMRTNDVEYFLILF